MRFRERVTYFIFGVSDDETYTSEYRPVWSRHVDFFTALGLFLFCAASVAAWNQWGSPTTQALVRHRLLEQFGVLLLAALPGLVAIVHYLVGTNKGFDTRATTVKEYRRYLEGFTRARSRGGIVFNPWAELLRDRIADYKPRFSYVLLAAFALTLSFALGAYVLQVPTPATIAKKVPSLQAGAVALGWVTVGAYLFTALAIVRRLYTSALTGKFLLATALRVGAIQALVFGVGSTNLFADVLQTSFGLGLFILMGWFPLWTFAFGRRRAQAVLQIEGSCEKLPLCLIDGVDEDIIERLEELGVWDVQHVATSDPGELTIRTLYPIHRVLDWIDQAILIIYVRRKIGLFREFGIRGAMDFLDVCERAPSAAQPTVLSQIAARTGVSEIALANISHILSNDFAVLLIRAIWQHDPAGAPSVDVIMEALRKTMNDLSGETFPTATPPPPHRKITPPFTSWPQPMRDAFARNMEEFLAPEHLYWRPDWQALERLTDWRSVADQVLAFVQYRKADERKVEKEDPSPEQDDHPLEPPTTADATKPHTDD